MREEILRAIADTDDWEDKVYLYSLLETCNFAEDEVEPFDYAVEEEVYA